MTMMRVPSGLELQTENSGGPIELVFSPEIPLGAHLTGAELDGKHLDAQAQESAQDEHATLRFRVPPGKGHCLVHFEGGVSLSVNSPSPLLGEPSKAIKIISAIYKPGSLVLNADVSQNSPAAPIELRTNEEPLQAHGAKLISVAKGTYELIIDPATAAGNNANPAPGDYRHIEITVDFAR
jgi:hypothetical protein